MNFDSKTGTFLKSGRSLILRALGRFCRFFRIFSKVCRPKIMKKISFDAESKSASTLSNSFLKIFFSKKKNFKNWIRKNFGFLKILKKIMHVWEVKKIGPSKPLIFKKILDRVMNFSSFSFLRNLKMGGHFGAPKNPPPAGWSEIFWKKHQFVRHSILYKLYLSAFFISVMVSEKERLNWGTLLKNPFFQKVKTFKTFRGL